MKLIKPLILSLLLCCCIIACTSLKTNVKPSQTAAVTFAKKQALTEAEKQTWHFKDFYTDSIPGISLEKAYDFLNNKKGDTIIVALIDTELDIDHKDLKDQVWINKGEIPNNNIDDDNNGYIDDIHGWNFLQTKQEEAVLYTHYSFVRFIKKYDSLFKNKTIQNIPANQKKQFQEYLRAVKRYNKEKKKVNSDIAAYITMKGKYIKADSLLTTYFPKKDYTISQLDSLIETTKDSILNTHIGDMKYYLKNNINVKRLDRGVKQKNEIFNTMLSFTYNDRQKQGDDPNDLSDVPYGNNNVQGTLRIDHGTRVMSIIAATRNNNIGIDGISNLAKIMFLGITPAGNEYDKDTSLAIRYAVDNGAKIINMSIGKEFSIRPEWLEEAFKYAESKDVLIVSSAGNQSYDLNTEFDYPDDYNENGEYVKNFIKIGASSYKADSTMVWLSSNYSAKNVDIFAPAHKIYSQGRRRTSLSSGTSYASAIVAGVASLIRSYYPNLSAIEVKEIIMKSGISFDVDVVQPYPYGEKQPKKKIPFSSMSKSGKIVNAYNALLMAEEVSKKKKQKRN